jgi:hypothetical protein
MPPHEAPAGCGTQDSVAGRRPLQAAGPKVGQLEPEAWDKPNEGATWSRALQGAIATLGPPLSSSPGRSTLRITHDRCS